MLWSFNFKVIRRDKALAEIDDELHGAGILLSGLDGVRDLAARFRSAYSRVQGCERRIYELEESVKEYERVFQRIKLAEQEAIVREQSEATPIEQAARAHIGIDLPRTDRFPVYAPDGVPETRRDKVVEPAEPTRRERIERSTLHLRSDQVPGKIGDAAHRMPLTQAEPDK